MKIIGKDKRQNLIAKIFNNHLSRWYLGVFKEKKIYKTIKSLYKKYINNIEKPIESDFYKGNWVSKKETCLEYYNRRLSEGWKVLKKEGYNVTLLSPSGTTKKMDLRNDVETIRPDGDVELAASLFPDSGAAWDKVDEVTPDEDDTYVFGLRNITSINVTQRFMCTFGNTSGSGEINLVTFYVRSRWSERYDTSETYFYNSNPPNYYSSVKYPVTDTYAMYSDEHLVNPDNDDAWTWEALDSYQLGTRFRLKGGGGSNYTQVRNTQLYIEIDFTPPPPAPPTVTTQAVTDVLSTSFTANGNITDIGSANATVRGFCYMQGDSGDPTVDDSVVNESGDFGTGAFNLPIT